MPATQVALPGLAFDALRWMRGFPSVYRSRAEGIDVAFYPDADTLTLQRPRRTELARDENWLWTSLSGALIPGENGAKFLLAGWSALELGPDRKGFRWIDGLQAGAWFPIVRQKPTVLAFEAKSFGPVADRQRLTVSLNGVAILTAPLDRNWRHFDVDLARAPVQRGTNRVELALTAAARPSDVAPGAPDGRNLSAAFQSLSVR